MQSRCSANSMELTNSVQSQRPLMEQKANAGIGFMDYYTESSKPISHLWKLGSIKQQRLSFTHEAAPIAQVRGRKFGSPENARLVAWATWSHINKLWSYWRTEGYNWKANSARGPWFFGYANMPQLPRYLSTPWIYFASCINSPGFQHCGSLKFWSRCKTQRPGFSSMSSPVCVCVCVCVSVHGTWPSDGACV